MDPVLSGFVPASDRIYEALYQFGPLTEPQLVELTGYAPGSIHREMWQGRKDGWATHNDLTVAERAQADDARAG